MKRFKRLYVLMGILLAACVVTLAVSQYETYKEDIRNSDEIILELSPDSVQSLSWEYDSQTLAFHREEETWTYDEDAAFPVDQDKIGDLLSLFEQFGVSFIIEEPEDLGMYGLDDPVCTINLTAEDEQAYTITLGDFSTMDSQRYVSIGDGNVYLVQTDPLDYFDVELRDLIDQDDVPYLSDVQEIRFSGTENYTVTYEEDSPNAYCVEDRYYTQQDGESLPLDTSRVEEYLNLISYLDLTNYVTYTADEEMLAQLGLDDPELVISVDYTEEDEDGNEVASTFQLSVSRDPEERQAAEEAKAEADQSDDAQTDEDSEEEEITAYVRVGDSKILYQITGDEYTALMAASYDDLRHLEVLPVDFDKMTSLDVTLDGTDYTITVQGDEDDPTYLLGEEEVEFDDVLSALSGLSADSFTQEQPTGQEEIRLTVHLDREELPSMEVVLYRYDGSFCLAQVDGQSVSLVPRSDVVDLIEALNAIVLN